MKKLSHPSKPLTVDKLKAIEYSTLVHSYGSKPLVPPIITHGFPYEFVGPRCLVNTDPTRHIGTDAALPGAPTNTLPP